LRSYIDKARVRFLRERARARMKYSTAPVMRVVEAALMAMLLGVVFGLAAEPVGLIVLVAGLIAFPVLMMRSDMDKVHFRFGIIFGTEWLMLPVAVSIARYRLDAIWGGIDPAAMLQVSIPLGVVMGLFFLSVALVFFMPQRKT
jgi:hypothetical protein